MKIFVQTRGNTADYAFLGGAPPDRWWRDDFHDATSFEQTTLIIKGNRTDWKCFISGIPSSRVDRVGSAIRYSIALEGQCGVEVDTILRLVAACLEDVSSRSPKGHVQIAMDHSFDEISVERLLKIRGRTSESATEVETLALKAFSELPLPKTSTGRLENDSWVDSLYSPDAIIEFLSRCSQLLRGSFDGNAAVLNLLGTADEAIVFASKFNSFAILIDDESVSLKIFIPIEKKKPPSVQPSTPKNSKPATSWRHIGVALGVIILAIWILTPKTSKDLKVDQTPQIGR